MQFLDDADRDRYFELQSRLRGAQTWKERITRCMPEAEFQPGATAADFAAVEKALGHGIPNKLKELLVESNGVEVDCDELFYSTSQIIKENRSLRTDEIYADRMPFDHLLIFGDVGDGDQFAFPLNRNGQFNDSVFIWSHESDCREKYANGLHDYLLKFTVELYTPVDDDSDDKADA